MANKGQITEEDLRGGLEGFGTFDTLTNPRPKKDNPFRSTVVAATPQGEAKSSEPQIEVPPVKAPLVRDQNIAGKEEVVPVASTKVIEVSTAVSEKVGKREEESRGELRPQSKVADAALTTRPRERKALSGAMSPEPEKIIRLKEPEVSGGKEEGRARKLDIYTERVTLNLSPEVRDKVERIARELQRNKTSKDERITANTVLRVAVQLLVDTFEVDSSVITNSEEELLKFLKQKFK